MEPVESPAPRPRPSRPNKRKAEASDERYLKRKVLNLVAERLETPPIQHLKYLETIRGDSDKTPEHMMPYVKKLRAEVFMLVQTNNLNSRSYIAEH